MSSSTITYTESYPVVVNNPIAQFLMYEPASTVVYPKNVNSKIKPCQPTVQSFNNVNSVKELPPCQPTLKTLQQSQYTLYPSVNNF